MEDSKNGLGKQQSITHLIIGILIFGSVWGFVEATLGGYLHMILFPNKGAIMSGIGVAIMGSALAIYKRPIMLLGIGIVAASFKLLNVWLLFVPITSIHITNPAMAIIFESLAFSLVAAFLMNRITGNAFAGVGAGVLAGFVSAITWVYFAIYVLDAPSYARVVFSAWEFIANQGVVQSIFSGLFFPLGLLAGNRMATTTSSVAIRRPLYYFASVVVICFCWGISAVATMAGL